MFRKSYYVHACGNVMWLFERIWCRSGDFSFRCPVLFRNFLDWRVLV